MPQRFYVHASGIGDRHVYASLTRFIPDALLPFFESCTWPAAAAQASADTAAHEPAPVIDIAARLRRLWR